MKFGQKEQKEKEKNKKSSENSLHLPYFLYDF